MKPEEFARAVAAHGSINKAAKANGVPRATAQNLYKRAGGKAVPGKNAEALPSARILTFPTLPNKLEPIDKLLQRRTECYQRNRAFADAELWHSIKINSRKPVGIAFIGDPHLDDDGCNWPLLMHHVAILRDQPGMFGVNIGDTTNNWVGNLARLFGKQETSQASARQLAEWFLTAAGINWLAILLGNHDAWNEGGEIIRRMVAAAKIEAPVSDWSAKFEVEFPTGAKVRINAAHNFKGHSMWNPTHGAMREATFSGEGDVFVNGHTHNYGLQQIKVGNRFPWFSQVSSYKEMDSYARVNGFAEAGHGAASLLIIDPTAPPATRCIMFGDLVQGAKVLAAMRGDDVAAIAKKAATVQKRPGKQASAKSYAKPVNRRNKSSKSKRGRK